MFISGHFDPPGLQLIKTTKIKFLKKLECFIKLIRNIFFNAERLSYGPTQTSPANSHDVNIISQMFTVKEAGSSQNVPSTYYWKI